MPVTIHGKQYITVAERVKEAGENFIALDTEVISENPVVVKATVTTKRGTFTGISSANPAKMIEKTNPYEVAETSAVGRALGFAGYGIVEGIATADEVIKSQTEENQDSAEWLNREDPKMCTVHGVEMLQAISKKTNKPYWWHKEDEKMCFGTGFKE